MLKIETSHVAVAWWRYALVSTSAHSQQSGSFSTWESRVLHIAGFECITPCTTRVIRCFCPWKSDVQFSPMQLALFVLAQYRWFTFDIFYLCYQVEEARPHVPWLHLKHDHRTWPDASQCKQRRLPHALLRVTRYTFPPQGSATHSKVPKVFQVRL